MEANRVYVLPPEKYHDGSPAGPPRLIAPPERAARGPLDRSVLGRSLAEDRRAAGSSACSLRQGPHGTLGLEGDQGRRRHGHRAGPETASTEACPATPSPPARPITPAGRADRTRKSPESGTSSPMSRRASNREPGGRPVHLDQLLDLLRATTRLDFTPVQAKTLPSPCQTPHVPPHMRPADRLHRIPASATRPRWSRAHQGLC